MTRTTLHRTAAPGGAPARSAPADSPATAARDLLAAWWPVLPAVATVLLLCVPAGHEDITEAVHITPADVSCLVLVVCCVVVLIHDRHRPLTLRAALVLAAPALAFAASTAASPDPVQSLPGFVRYLQIFVLVPVALLLLLRTRRDFRTVAAAVVLIAVVQGAIGVHQYLTGTGASYAGQDVRAVGTFGPLDIMGLAGVVAHGLITALAVGLAAPPSAPRWLRPSALLCAALLTVPLVMSFSRGVWLSTALAALVVLLLAGLRTALRTLIAVLLAGAAIAGFAGVGTGLIGERLTSITRIVDAPDRSVTDRYSMWSAATEMWQTQPVTGVGIKQFPENRDSHASIGLSSGSDIAGAGVEFRREPLLSPHNMYLLILSEQGLLGLVLVVGSWGLLLVAVLRRLRGRLRGPRTGDCGLVAAGLLVLQLADFLSADIGGPSTVLTAVTFGMAAWWAFSPAAAAEGPVPR
ncbi:O-antigen ligase family protein [Streptomyces meridianus]|uniref:O-antigen ligase family protein n=1 Tax=Streptomyces meridianus TaxID=2938945 RepID=A0ABT0X6U6_9ACTN|nr:O-antigen ligase family protein [Streptomyces meridianus]MCM2578236.1 O-antigen ligase family protein [Streptomyces meridianus]